MAEWVQFGTGKLCGMVQKALCTAWYNTANSVGALWTKAWYGWAQHGYYLKGNGRWQWRMRYRHIMVQPLLLGIWYFVIWYLNAGKRILPSTGSKVVSLTLSLPPWLPHHQIQVNKKLTKITTTSNICINAYRGHDTGLENISITGVWGIRHTGHDITR